jgi:bifunctional non-homologous end joining protein LigD
VKPEPVRPWPRYPAIIRAASHLPCHSAIIDGEAILPRGDGASDFEAFQSAVHDNPHSIILYAFDLMHVDGTDLRRESLAVRRSILKALIGRDEESRIQFSEEFVGEGAVLLKACAEHGLEGIMSKQALAPYRSGRTKTWLKTKCFTESTFVVIGTDRDRETGALRALLAHPDSDGMKYAGAAFIALSDEARIKFLAELERFTTSWAAFKTLRLIDVKWCEPRLMVRVAPCNRERLRALDRYVRNDHLCDSILRHFPGALAACMVARPRFAQPY